MLTSRFFGLALICPALLLLSAVLPALAPVSIVYGIGLIALAILDRRQAGSAAQFEISRAHDQKLSLAALNRIVLNITSRTDHAVGVTVRDEPPDLFVGADLATRSGTVGPRETITLDYSVRPLRRGDFAFGILNVRWTGPLRFYTR